MAKVARENRAATVLLPAKTGQFLGRAEDGTRIPKPERRRRPATHSAPPPQRHHLRCFRAFPGLPSKVRRAAPSSASSRAKPERSGGADPGPIPLPSTGIGRGRHRMRAGAVHRGMGSGYARLRCARRSFRNDAAAAGHPGVTRGGPAHRGQLQRPRGPRPRLSPRPLLGVISSAASERSRLAIEDPPRRPLLGVIPGEAGAKRRRRPGTHSAPVDRQGARAGPGARTARARSIAEWVPDTPASAALGGRSGMTRRLPDIPGSPEEAPRIGVNSSGPAVLARASAPAPSSAPSTPLLPNVPGLPSKVSRAAPSPASSRAKPERSGGADPGPIPRALRHGTAGEGRRPRRAMIPGSAFTAGGRG
jgi:hypothetical protein